MSLTTAPKMPNPGSRSQNGQALPFALAFAISAALVALLLFNSGMLANSKTRLQNTADAAAYSAGVLQARDHNFSAYTNRAMVANQVAVVQLVSLKSYLEDASNTHQRMSGPILTLEELLPTSKPNWDFAKSLPVETVSLNFSTLAGRAVTGLDKLIVAFEKAQDAHHKATLLDMVMVADEVVKRNEPNARVSQGTFTLGRTQVQVRDWADSTQSHKANDDSATADRFADVVVSENSTDQFTRNRFSSPTPRWYSEVMPCTWAPNYVSSFTTFNFAHAGGSILSTDKKRWLALDATLGGGLTTCTFWIPCLTGICYINVSSILIDDNFGMGGSGGGVAGAFGGYDSATGYRKNPSSTAYYGGAMVNPLTMLPAGIRYNRGPGNTLDSAGGLQDYYRDVANPTGSIPQDQAPENNGGAYPITIEIERPANTINTSSKLMQASTFLKINDGLKSDTMRTLSSAHTFFFRPKTDDSNIFTRQGWGRADSKAELANLFNP